MELFQALSGAKFQAVHYKGATPALTDVMAGDVQGCWSTNSGGLITRYHRQG
jgi:hypothetical protein